MAMGSRGEVEQRGLTAVGITHESYIDRTALFHGHVMQVVVGVVFWI